MVPVAVTMMTARKKEVAAVLGEEDGSISGNSRSKQRMWWTASRGKMV